MAQRLTRLLQLVTDYTQAEEDIFADTLSGVPAYSSVIFNTTLESVRYWTGIDFSTVPDITPNSLPLATSTTQGVVPPTGTPSGLFLKDDLTWSPATGSGGGTVTSFIFTNSTGITGTVTLASSTPTLALSLTNAAVGLSNVSNNAQLTISNNLSDLANVVTARTNLGLGSVALLSSIAANTLTGTTLASGVITSSLTTIGTITSGGLGTGAVLGEVTLTLGSDAANDIYYRNGSGVLTRLANGTTGQVLTATTGGAPSWSTGGGGGISLPVAMIVSSLRI